MARKRSAPSGSGERARKAPRRRNLAWKPFIKEYICPALLVLNSLDDEELEALKTLEDCHLPGVPVALNILHSMDFKEYASRIPSAGQLFLVFKSLENHVPPGERWPKAGSDRDQFLQVNGHTFPMHRFKQRVPTATEPQIRRFCSIGVLQWCIYLKLEHDLPAAIGQELQLIQLVVPPVVTQNAASSPRIAIHAEGSESSEDTSSEISSSASTAIFESYTLEIDLPTWLLELFDQEE